MDRGDAGGRQDHSMAPYEPALADWSALPSPVLDLVSCQIAATTDYPCFHAVCTSWQTATPARSPHLPCQQMALPFPEASDVCHFFSLPDGKTQRRAAGGTGQPLLWVLLRLAGLPPSTATGDMAVVVVSLGTRWLRKGGRRKGIDTGSTCWHAGFQLALQSGTGMTNPGSNPWLANSYCTDPS